MNQLRALMQSQIEVAATPSSSPPIATAPQPPKTVTPPKEPPLVFAREAPTRYSLRLLPTEIAKINSIIKNTVQTTDQRITLTDVLRVGLGRLGESTPVSTAELAVLRTTDGRRH